MAHVHGQEPEDTRETSTSCPELEALEVWPHSHNRGEIMPILAELISEAPPMDDVFYKERARHIRELATHADPFIKNRLLQLASNYDAMTTRPKATALSNPSDASPDNFAEADRGH
jgi:hypothetical protein